MSNAVETSIVDATDPRDRDNEDGTVRHRLGGAKDHGEVKEASINETTIETPVSPSNAALEDDMEYVRGHPVIKNGMRQDYRLCL
jgi:hypothetical protein